MTGASARIADFILGFDEEGLSEQARHTARRALIDTVAVALAGRGEPASRCVQDYARLQSGRLEAIVWASGERLPVEMAALVNGAMGHVLDYDDVTSPMRGHPSIALCPALVALAEATGASYGRMLAAYVVGFELICKLSRAIAGDHYAKGWHTTATIGSLGATAALAYLAGLPRDAIASALGLAVAQASGTLENFGTMAKSFQAGQAGATALRAVLLAQRGFTASPDALDGKRGFTALYADGQSIAAEMEGLGAMPLEIERSGIEIKKYPLCYATHRAIDGLLDLKAEHPGLSLSQIEQVEVTGSHHAFVPLIHAAPRTGLEGKFSMQYAVTAALADGAVRLSSFTDAAVGRPEVQAFFGRVRPAEAEGSLLPRWTHLALRLADGTRLERRVDALRGSAELPLSDEELLAKVEDCCLFSQSGVDAQHLLRVLLSTGEGPMADVLTDALHAPPRPPSL